MPTIAVCNLKGGVGKTTVTFNVAAALAEMGHRVLLIDADAHCSLTHAFGMLGESPTLADVLRGQVTVAGAARPTFLEGVSLVPAGPGLDEINRRNLASERVLLARLPETAGYTLIDCPPGASTTLANALVAADDVLAPVQAQGMAQGGVERLVSLIRDFRSRSANAGLDLIGLLVNKFDRRTRISWKVLEELRQEYGSLVFDVVVHEAAALAESTDRRAPVIRALSHVRAATEIRDATWELTHRSEIRDGYFGRGGAEARRSELRVVGGRSPLPADLRD